MLIQEEHGDGRTCHGMQQGYSEQGIQVHPCILDEFEGAVLDSVPYQNAKFVFEIHGHGDSYTVKLDGNPLEGFFGKEMTGEHKVDIYAHETE